MEKSSAIRLTELELHLIMNDGLVPLRIRSFYPDLGLGDLNELLSVGQYKIIDENEIGE